MIRRPPRSTLFPYTSSSDLHDRLAGPQSRVSRAWARWPESYLREGAALPPRAVEVFRSEEHTSELQSRLHLVCRLLLEKKKKCHPSIVAQMLSALRLCILDV